MESLSTDILSPMEPQYAYKVTLVLANVLEKMANTSVVQSNPSSTVFDANTPPKIGVQQYLERIFKYTMCSGECYVLALIYIDRFRKSAMQLTPYNIHRVIITSVMLAAKFFEDAYYNNAYFAQVGGVPTVEINQMELDFLFFVSFKLHVPTLEFQSYRTLFHDRLVSAEKPAATPLTAANHRPSGQGTPQSQGSHFGVNSGGQDDAARPTQKRPDQETSELKGSRPPEDGTHPSDDGGRPRQGWPEEHQQQWGGDKTSWQHQQNQDQGVNHQIGCFQEYNQQQQQQQEWHHHNNSHNAAYGRNNATQSQQWNHPWQNGHGAEHSTGNGNNMQGGYFKNNDGQDTEMGGDESSHVSGYKPSVGGVNMAINGVQSDIGENIYQPAINGYSNDGFPHGANCMWDDK